MRRALSIVVSILLLCLTTHAQDVVDFSMLTSSKHPRLLMDDAELLEVKTEIANGRNNALNSIHRTVMHLADSIVVVDAPVEYRFDESNKRLLLRSREALTRIFYCAYAYRFTGEERYLAHAEKDILDVCAFPNWNPSHFLDVGEMAAAVGLGLDWLYNGLKESTKAKATETIDRYAFKPAANEDVNWFYYNEGNWNQVCNGGLTVAAIASFERLDTASTRIITDAISSNRAMMKKIYSPDGNYGEGPDYWNYGNIFQTLMLSALETALGSDFGLSETEGFRSTAEYLLFTRGCCGKVYNYYDNPAKITDAYSLWYFADKFNDSSLLYNDLAALEGRDYTQTDCIRLLPMLIPYAYHIGKKSGGRLASDGIAKPSKHLFSGHGITPVVMCRGDWSGTEEDWYLGIKGGTPNSSHAHMDGGSFVFEAHGVRWATDLSGEKYQTAENGMRALGADLWDLSQNSFRWRMFKLNNRQHNTLTVNGHDHNTKGKATLLKAIDTPNSKGGVFNLTELFTGDLSSATRTVTVDNGSSLIVKDVLTAEKDANIRWTMVTEAEPQLTKKGIVLSKDGKKMLLSVKGQTGKVDYCQWSNDPSDYDSPTASFESKNGGIWIVGFTTDIPAGRTVTLITELKAVK